MNTFALSAEVQGVLQLRTGASCLRHARAKLRAGGARRTLAPTSFHEDRSSRTTPPTRRTKTSSGALAASRLEVPNRNHWGGLAWWRLRSAPSEGLPGRIDVGPSAGAHADSAHRARRSTQASRQRLLDSSAEVCRTASRVRGPMQDRRAEECARAAARVRARALRDFDRLARTCRRRAVDARVDTAAADADELARPADQSRSRARARRDQPRSTLGGERTSSERLAGLLGADLPTAILHGC